jgi:hypothetical protein
MADDPKRPAETGFVLLTTIMLLALVTIVVFSAMRTSAVELQISANEQIHQQTFYLAEAGIAHGVKSLLSLFEQENAPGVRTGAMPVWDFAFHGPDQIVGTADDARGKEGQPGSYERGAQWLNVRLPNGTRYTVTLWNNDEDGFDADYDTDRDGLIWLRSDASGFRGGRVRIQVLLLGADAGNSGAAVYPAQAGGRGYFSETDAASVNPGGEVSNQTAQQDCLTAVDLEGMVLYRRPIPDPLSSPVVEDLHLDETLPGGPVSFGAGGYNNPKQISGRLRVRVKAWQQVE